MVTGIGQRRIGRSDYLRSQRRGIEVDQPPHFAAAPVTGKVIIALAINQIIADNFEVVIGSIQKRPAAACVSSSHFPNFVASGGG